MKKHIAEGLPERKHAPAAAAPAGGGKTDEKRGGKESKTPEARVRQAVYDIRYRARREEVPLQKAFQDYMNHSTMSGKEKTLVRAKLFGKGGMQAEDFNMVDAASSNVANALYRVFVEGAKQEEPIVLTYMEKLETGADRKYKVRVTDKSGSSYVRYATREKISTLRANPNIESVEMTGYGEPYEGERKGGKQTAAAKRGDNLDPVGQEDGDIDNDGDKDRTDKYLLNRRKVRGAAISQRGGVKEAFLDDANDESANPDANKSEIGVMKGKKNIVKINPELPGSSQNTRLSTHYAHYEAEGEVIAETDGYSKFLGMLQEKKLTKKEKAKKEEIAKALKPKYGKTSKTYAIATAVAKKVAEETDQKLKTDSGKECDDYDRRSLPTKKSLIASKFQSMGVKNPIVMVAGYKLEGEVLDELNREARESGEKSGGDPAIAAQNKRIAPARIGGSRQKPKKRGEKPSSPSEEAAKSGVLSPLQHKLERIRAAKKTKAEFEMDTKGT